MSQVQIEIGKVTFHILNKNFLIIITAKQVATSQ